MFAIGMKLKTLKLARPVGKSLLWWFRTPIASVHRPARTATWQTHTSQPSSTRSTQMNHIHACGFLARSARSDRQGIIAGPSEQSSVRASERAESERASNTNVRVVSEKLDELFGLNLVAPLVDEFNDVLERLGFFPGIRRRKQAKIFFLQTPFLLLVPFLSLLLLLGGLLLAPLRSLRRRLDRHRARHHGHVDFARQRHRRVRLGRVAHEGRLPVGRVVHEGHGARPVWSNL